MEGDRNTVKMQIERGNIVYCNTDAIVLPANEYLREGSGTSHAIFSEAGREALTKACDAIKTPVERGMTIPTAGYRLRANYILHSVISKWVDGKHHEYELLSTAYRSALEVADRMKCKSIAFPLLSSGNNGFERELAFKIATETIRRYEPVNLKKTVIIVYEKEMAVFAQSKGYDVRDRFKEGRTKNSIKRAVRSVQKGVNTVAKLFVDDAIKMGKDYLEDENNRKRLIRIGAEIAGAVLLGQMGK